MKPEHKKLMLVFCIILVAKIILSLFIKSPSIFSDEYFYFKMAESFSQEYSISVHQQPTNAYPPLYPMIMSLAHLADNNETNYLLAKILNAIISTLVIIPAFLLSKEFVSERKSLMISSVAALLPSSFSLTYYIMSENLFYPLFLFSIYFMYKSFSGEKKLYSILAGAFAGLSLLTRTLGAGLVIIYFLSQVILFIKFKDYKKTLKQSIIFFIFMLIIISPWLIRNYAISESVKEAAFGQYSDAPIARTANFTSLIFWILAYFGYIIISSLFVFAPFSLKSQQGAKKEFIISVITYVSIVVVILIATKYAAGSTLKGLVPWATGRPIGRYIEFILPLVLITGYAKAVQFKNKRMQPLLKYVAIIPLLAFSLLVLYKLFPINNVSVSWIGTLKLVYDYVVFGKKDFEPVFSITSIILMAVILISIFILSERLFSKKPSRFMICAVIFLISTNMLNFVMIKYSSDTWYDNENAQLGIWINKNIKTPSVILIDSGYCSSNDLKDINTLCNRQKNTALASFWFNHKAYIGDLTSFKNFDYLITKTELKGKELIKSTPSGTLLYKN